MTNPADPHYDPFADDETTIALPHDPFADDETTIARPVSTSEREPLEDDITIIASGVGTNWAPRPTESTVGSSAQATPRATSAPDALDIANPLQSDLDIAVFQPGGKRWAPPDRPRSTETATTVPTSSVPLRLVVGIVALLLAVIVVLAVLLANDGNVARTDAEQQTPEQVDQ